MERADRAGLRLLALLDKCNALLYLYEAICKWKDEEASQEFDQPLDIGSANLPCRKTLLSNQERNSSAYCRRGWHLH
jgi:hypothetical protein